MPAGYQTKFDRENRISSIIGTLGGVGMTQIFIHDHTSGRNTAELVATVPGLEKYDQRALLLARPDDLVCVASRVDNQYLQFLSILGIGPRDGNVVMTSKSTHPDSVAMLSHALMSDYEPLLKLANLIKRNDRIVLNPFIASAREFKLAAILQTMLGRKIHVLGGNPDIVDYANGKHNVRTKAIELGVPVSEGQIIELQLQEDGRPLDLTPLQVAISQYIHRTGRVIVKGAHGAGGSSIIVVENTPESVRKALSKIAGRSDNRLYLVEVMLDVVVSPNVVIHIEPGNGRILCVSVTDQHLSEKLVHKGNTYPPIARSLRAMISSAQKISKWLQGQGYNGLAGFDFVEYLDPETGEFEHFLAEINARINASIYPKSLIECLNIRQAEKGRPCIEAFLSTVVKTKARSFAEIVGLYGHLFFNPKTGKGLVPYNTGCLEIGKFSLAVLGKSRNEVGGLYENFKTLIAKEIVPSQDTMGTPRESTL